MINYATFFFMHKGYGEREKERERGSGDRNQAYCVETPTDTTQAINFPASPKKFRTGSIFSIAIILYMAQEPCAAISTVSRSNDHNGTDHQ